MSSQSHPFVLIIGFRNCHKSDGPRCFLPEVHGRILTTKRSTITEGEWSQRPGSTLRYGPYQDVNYSGSPFVFGSHLGSDLIFDLNQEKSPGQLVHWGRQFSLLMNHYTGIYLTVELFCQKLYLLNYKNTY